ncbi:DUF3080 domain-containing protein [Marinobacter vulgaris]|uniref:DUF3080 domain-containing protein n=1 Tax=Marinobacter vulgaris TaxID=1928331 RepID=A0A2V3ZL71_9GAMM|nr:DUF3080 family protein [Marinobacter vulgaris]PXX91497.1 DUF3080 domain-containing protein [Marinobacter vulgaris]TSJ71002.1 DUF3080 domain-containing protein [Marinobacter vulgaris]
MPDTKCLTAVVLCVSLTACAPDSGVPEMMDGYVEQVAEALELSPSLSGVAPVPQIPRRRERVLEMPDLDMGMLDFLSLYGCELQYVVGEKNSIMGRVMQPLNRLRYETRFIRAARDCMPEAEREGVKGELEEAIESKSETLAIALWNATWGVEEMERLFTRSQGYYPKGSGDPVAAELAAGVRQLNQTVAGLLNGDTSEPLDYVGEVQQRWQAEHRAGQLMNSARLLAARLDDATALLVERIETDPLCTQATGSEPPGAVAKAYVQGYVESVKPYVDSIDTARGTLIEPLGNLATQQTEIMPDAFRQWYRQSLDTENTASLWGQLDRAVEAHSRHWQQLLDQCDVSPEP